MASDIIQMSSGKRNQFPLTVAEAVKMRDGTNLEDVLGGSDTNTFSKIVGTAIIRRNLAKSFKVGYKIDSTGAEIEDADYCYCVVNNAESNTEYLIRYNEHPIMAYSVVFFRSESAVIMNNPELKGIINFTTTNETVKFAVNMQVSDFTDTTKVRIYKADYYYNTLLESTPIAEQAVGNIPNMNMYVIGDSVVEADGWYPKFERETNFRTCTRRAHGGWTFAPTENDAPSSTSLFKGFWSIIRDEVTPLVDGKAKNVFYIDGGSNDRNIYTVGDLNTAIDFSVSYVDKITNNPTDADCATIMGAVRLYVEYLWSICQEDPIIIFALPHRWGGRTASEEHATNQKVMEIGEAIRTAANYFGCPVIDKGALLGPFGYYNIGQGSRNVNDQDGYWVHPYQETYNRWAGVIKNEVYNILRYR